jgi:nucleoside-diphosphate-sugar epimerase
MGYSHQIAELMQCIKNEDVMFHEAAIANITLSIGNLMFAHDVSVILTLSLLETEYSISIKRFVLASSAAAHGLILTAIL